MKLSRISLGEQWKWQPRRRHGHPVGVSFTTLDGPLWWNFILICFSGGIVSPVCNIYSGETFVLLVSAAWQWWNFTTCWIGKLWSKNSLCWCPVRKLFYCSSLLRSVVFLSKWNRIRIDIECSQKFAWPSRFVQRRCVFYTFKFSSDYKNKNKLDP